MERWTLLFLGALVFLARLGWAQPQRLQVQVQREMSMQLRVKQSAKTKTKKPKQKLTRGVIFGTIRKKRIPQSAWLFVNKRNQLGTYWLRLGQSKIGLHGTNKPANIGGYTYGCVAFCNQDIKYIAQRLKTRSRVYIAG